VATSQNRVLAALSDEDLGALRPFLEEVALPHAMILERAGQVIEHVYFPLTGLASTLAVNINGERSEVSLYGRDGMTGSSVINGTDRSLLETTMQIPGHGLRVERGRLQGLMREHRSMHDLFLLFSEARVAQMSQTALSNARHSIEERLARWLLMSHDRVDGDELPLTHEFLAIMLGVRRAGVTTALHILEGQHLIRSTRGLVTVRDRDGLKATAGAAYGAPEAEYLRLMGRPI
jgi:CRP-like cAMP-binding protein